jgi:hypothetical protein
MEIPVSALNGNGNRVPRTAAEVAGDLREILGILTDHLRHPLNPPAQGITMDANMAHDVCLAFGQLWKVARLISTMRPSWIHHMDGGALHNALKDLDPRLVPEIQKPEGETKP